MDSVKAEAIMKWHATTNVTEVLSFMGLVGYYQLFVELFSKIANPITKLQKKNKKLFGPRNAWNIFEGSRSC
jgi:hypothetical protein